MNEVLRGQHGMIFRTIKYVISFMVFILWELPRNMIRLYIDVIKWESGMVKFEKVLKNMRKRK